MNRDEDAYIAGLTAGWNRPLGAGVACGENDESVLAMAAAAPTWYYLDAHGPYATLEAEAEALYAFAEGFKYAMRQALRAVHMKGIA